MRETTLYSMLKEGKKILYHFPVDISFTIGKRSVSPLSSKESAAIFAISHTFY